MNRRTRIAIAAAAAAAAIAGATAATVASGGVETPLTGSARDRAAAAALAQVGGGSVTETEVGDDGAAYTVEVRLADGSQVEVRLDGAFHVLGSAPDDGGPGDADATGSGEDD